MKVLPAVFYRDPAECIDELRSLDAQAKRKAERERLNKGRRIRALVREVMRSGGDKHGK